MRIIKAAGAAIAVVALLLGVPVALLAWGHPEVLLQVDWATALTRPDDGRVFLGLLSVLAWAAWLVVAATTVAELASALSRGAVSIRLSADDLAQLEQAVPRDAVAGPRYGDLSSIDT